MKKLLLTLLLLFSLGLAAKAETMAFQAANASAQSSATTIVDLPTGSIHSQTFSDAASTCSFYLTKNANDDQVNGGWVRWYSGSKITITPGESVTINSITIHCGDGKFSTITIGSTKIATSSSNPDAVFSNLNATGALTISNSAQTRFSYLEIDYTITSSKRDSEISYSSETASIILGEDYELPTLSNPYNLPINYASSNPAVASIDESGIVTIGEKAGTTEISASFTGNDEYKAYTAKYILTVVDPNFKGYTLLTKMDDLYDGVEGLLVCGNYNVAMNNKTNQATYRQSSPIEINEDKTITTLPEDIQIVVFHKVEGGYTLQVGEQYLRLESSANNLRTGDEMTASITLDNNNNAKIAFTNYPTRFINCNNSDKRFACYLASSNQTPIQIYIPAQTQPSLDGDPTIEVKHGPFGGVLTVNYDFYIKNYNNNTVEVVATVDGMPEVVFAKVEPTNAPARAAAESTRFTATLKATHENLKGAPTPTVNVAATIDGNNLFTVAKGAGDIITTGIEDVTVEGEGEAEYYNLQGLRVAQPEAGQLYIKRQGGKAVKVRF